MSLANYADLQLSVKDWLARFDSTVSNRVPDFIRLGEERIWNRVRLSPGVEPLSGLVVGAGTNYGTLPTNFLAFKRLSTSRYPTIDYMTPDALARLPLPGRGDRYTIEGGRLYLGETGAAPVTLTGAYYKHPGYLSDAGTTWLLVRWPSIYLYAALLEASLFLKNSARVGEFGTLLDRAIEGADSSDRAAMISGGPLRSFR